MLQTSTVGPAAVFLPQNARAEELAQRLIAERNARIAQFCQNPAKPPSRRHSMAPSKRSRKIGKIKLRRNTMVTSTVAAALSVAAVVAAAVPAVPVPVVAAPFVVNRWIGVNGPGALAAPNPTTALPPFVPFHFERRPTLTRHPSSPVKHSVYYFFLFGLTI